MLIYELRIQTIP